MKKHKDPEYTNNGFRKLYYDRDRLEFIHTFHIDVYMEWNPIFQMDDFGNAVPFDTRSYAIKELKPYVIIDCLSVTPKVLHPMPH